MTRGFDLDAGLEKRAQQTPTADDAGARTPKSVDSSQGGAGDAFSVPAGRAERVAMNALSQGGTVDASSGFGKKGRK